MHDVKQTTSTLSKSQKAKTTEQKDPFAGSISASEFIRHIKSFQQSVDFGDIQLRNAAQEYMSKLHCE